MTSRDGGRPTSGKILNGYVSATSCPVHSVFGSRVRLSGSADPLALLSAVMLENVKWILAMGHQVHFIFGSMPGFLGRLIEWLWLRFSMYRQIMCAEYTLDWLQSKIFLVIIMSHAPVFTKQINVLLRLYWQTLCLVI